MARERIVQGEAKVYENGMAYIGKDAKGKTIRYRILGNEEAALCMDCDAFIRVAPGEEKKCAAHRSLSTDGGKGDGNPDKVSGNPVAAGTLTTSSPAPSPPLSSKRKKNHGAKLIPLSKPPTDDFDALINDVRPCLFCKVKLTDCESKKKNCCSGCKDRERAHPKGEE